MAGLCLAAAGAAAGATAAPRLARRQLLSLNMASAAMHKMELAAAATYEVTLPLETDATAIRIGLGNIHPAPYRIDDLCVLRPDGTAADFTIGGATGGPFMVPGNAPAPTGAGNVPAIVWSDWLPYETAAATARPQLTFRALVPPQTLPMAVVPYPKSVQVPALANLPRLIAARATPGDYVADPARQGAAWVPVHDTPIYVIQYRTKIPGVQMVIGGDSHLAMYDTFARLAANHLSTPAAPISVWDAAWSGMPSNTFWPALDDAIDLSRPSIAVIQGWTANDGMKPKRDEAYLTRVQESASRTQAAGGIPVIVKGLPRHLFGKPELASWQAINSQLGTLVPGAAVFDPPRYVEDPLQPGNWIQGLSDDGVHPNYNGNDRLRMPFQQLLAALGI